MSRIEPLVPGKRDPLDVCLGWIWRYKKLRDKEVAALEADRAELILDLEYVAQNAVTMVHAPEDDRRRVAAEITSVMEDAGLWKPEERPS